MLKRCAQLLMLSVPLACACSEASGPPVEDDNLGGAAAGDGAGGDPSAGTSGGGASGAGGAAPECDAEPFDCEDCPALEDFRDSCAEAAPTACGGTIVGPLSAAPFSYTYCYANDGTLIGKISQDSDSPSSRIVDGADCAAAGPSEALCDDGPLAIVTPESETLRISWFNYFLGGYRFERRLDQLSTEQLELAQAIHVIPPTGDCWEDAVGMQITVSDGDSEREFFANEFSGTCGSDRTLVDFEAVTALLGTVDCLSAKGYQGETPETAPSITADDGCFHGLFNASGSRPDWWFRAEIPSAGEYAFVIDGCGDRRIVLNLFEEDATTNLASTSETLECPTLTHTFTAAGSYVLRVSMVGGSYAGDFFLGLESTSQ